MPSRVTYKPLATYLPNGELTFDFENMQDIYDLITEHSDHLLPYEVLGKFNLFSFVEAFTPHFYQMFYDNQFAGLIWLQDWYGVNADCYKGKFFSCQASLVFKPKFHGVPVREMCKHIMDIVFTDEGAFRVEFRIHPANIAAKVLARHMKAKKEGLLRGGMIHKGKPASVEVWSIIRPDYIKEYRGKN